MSVAMICWSCLANNPRDLAGDYLAEKFLGTNSVSRTIYLNEELLSVSRHIKALTSFDFEADFSKTCKPRVLARSAENDLCDGGETCLGRVHDLFGFDGFKRANEKHQLVGWCFS